MEPPRQILKKRVHVRLRGNVGTAEQPQYETWTRDEFDYYLRESNKRTLALIRASRDIRMRWSEWDAVSRARVVRDLHRMIRAYLDFLSGNRVEDQSAIAALEYIHNTRVAMQTVVGRWDTKTRVMIPRPGVASDAAAELVATLVLLNHPLLSPDRIVDTEIRDKSVLALRDAVIKFRVFLFQHRARIDPKTTLFRLVSRVLGVDETTTAEPVPEFPGPQIDLYEAARRKYLSELATPFLDKPSVLELMDGPQVDILFDRADAIVSVVIDQLTEHGFARVMEVPQLANLFGYVLARFPDDAVKLVEAIHPDFAAAVGNRPGDVEPPTLSLFLPDVAMGLDSRIKVLLNVLATKQWARSWRPIKDTAVFLSLVDYVAGSTERFAVQGLSTAANRLQIEVVRGWIAFEYGQAYVTSSVARNMGLHRVMGDPKVFVHTWIVGALRQPHHMILRANEMARALRLTKQSGDFQYVVTVARYLVFRGDNMPGDDLSLAFAVLATHLVAKQPSKLVPEKQEVMDQLAKMAAESARLQIVQYRRNTKAGPLLPVEAKRKREAEKGKEKEDLPPLKRQEIVELGTVDDIVAAIRQGIAFRIAPGLTKLDLGRNRVGDQGASALAASLVQNQTLTGLRLMWNNIGDQGASALATAMAQNQTLTNLDLSENEIGDQGASALATTLPQNQTLTSLNLGGNGIGDQGASAVVTMLTQNQTLTSLILERNSIGDHGANALAAALAQNQTLTSLDLKSNEITTEGIKSLVNALVDNSTLLRLRISGNPGADDVAKYQVDVRVADAQRRLGSRTLSLQLRRAFENPTPERIEALGHLTGLPPELWLEILRRTGGRPKPMTIDRRVGVAKPPTDPTKRILAVTWNTAGLRKTQNQWLDDDFEGRTWRRWIEAHARFKSPDGSLTGPDVVVLALQEWHTGHRFADAFHRWIEQATGTKYLPYTFTIKSIVRLFRRDFNQQLTVFLQAGAVSRGAAVEQVAEVCFGASLTCTKGSIVVRLTLPSGKHIYVVASHFPFKSETDVEERNRAYRKTLAKAPELEPRTGNTVLWLGDLNYRMLTGKPPDQLDDERRAGRAFEGFKEPARKFPPTCKLFTIPKNADERRKQDWARERRIVDWRRSRAYDDAKRAPSYCDRILVRGTGIEYEEYDMVDPESTLESDHNAVAATLRL